MNTVTYIHRLSSSRIVFRAAALMTLLALAPAAGIAAGYWTHSAPETRVARVSLADLDLSTPAGLRAAHDRLHETARRLCSQLQDELSLSHQPNYVICVDKTTAAALQQVKVPALAANEK